VECRWSTHCTGDNKICEAQTCRAARDCHELKTELPGLPNGVYTIDLDGTGAAPPIKAACEMTVNGGGWTLVQRTRWAWADSMALYTNYATWHDMTIGQPNPGSAYRLAGSQWPTLGAQSGLMMVHRLHTTAGGACGPLYYVAQATVAVDSATSTATLSNITQPVPLVAGPDLSTTDSGPSMAGCVIPGSAVPWFYTACCSTCVTYKGGYWLDEPHPMANYTTTADFFGSTEATACSGQTVRLDDSGSTFRGVDSMEVYLR
jgi:hypothetical protein